MANKNNSHRTRIYALAALAASTAAMWAVSDMYSFQRKMLRPTAITGEAPAAITPEKQVYEPQPAEPIRFEKYISPQNELIGMKITIDTMVIDEWAKYAPLTITVPEASYSAPFPVENGAKSAETNFPSPASPSGTYHYIVFGWDKKTGAAKELYRQILSPQGK
jgi:hypothetical protein